MGLLKTKQSSKNKQQNASLKESSSFSFPKNKDIGLVSGDLDRKLVYSLSKSRFPSWKQIKYIGRVLGKKESFLLKFFFLLMLASVGFLCFGFCREHIKSSPVFGGQYTEGVIGYPQHINPLYSSVNDVDSDLSRLVYSSLFKTNEKGELEKDLVEDYSVSEDGKVYTFKIKDGVLWHRGGSLTVDDIFFTFQAIKDPAYNSPLKTSFVGVEAKIEDERTISFSLSERYAPFLNLLTFGILPSSVWGRISPQSAPLADFNLKPIGSGPYRAGSWIKDKSGKFKQYKLEANNDYYGKKPYIKEVIFKFFANATEAVNALNNGSVDGLSYLPKEEKQNLIAKSSLNINEVFMPREKVLFFNSSKNVILSDKNVRQALSYATPRQRIISEVLDSQAVPAYGPISERSFAYDGGLEKYDFDMSKAEKILSDAGWKKETVSEEDFVLLKDKEMASSSSLSDDEKNFLSLGVGSWFYKEEPRNKNDKKNTEKKKIYLRLSLTVLDDEESANTGRLILQSWEKFGAKVDLDLVSASQVQAFSIKPRSYEVLLFSQFLGSDPDPYFFWHSSQAGEGGLNLSNFKDDDVDKLLEEARISLDQNERVEKYKKFQQLINQDAAAIFLFSPFYLYPQGKRLKDFGVEFLANPSDRFSDISDWYVKTGYRFVW